MPLTPARAVWLCLLVPGLPQLLLGHAARGLVAFVLTVGCFFAGYAILGERLWYFELFEPFSLLAPVLYYVPIQLLPESGNLGSVIVAALMRPDETPEVLRLMRLPRDFEHIGLFLTGTSGVLGFFWAADAHWLARRVTTRGMQPGTAALLTWLLPGAGHYVAGQRDKGMLIFAAVATVWTAGLLLARGHAVDRPLSMAWWIGDALFGAGTAFAAFVTGPLRFAAIPEHYDLGIALCCVAGFMAVIAACDAYTVAETRAEAAAAAVEAA